MDNTGKGIVVKEYLRKYAHLGSRTIAKMIMVAYPEIFLNEEQARGMVRYYRGSAGQYNRDKMNDETLIPRVNAPPSDNVPYEPFLLGPEAFPMIIGADFHVPYHDQDVVEMFVEKGVRDNVKTVLLAGDVIDFYLLSNFTRDPRMRDISGEFDILIEILDMIHENIPNAKIIYKIGNHEERYDHYVMSRAPELFGLEDIHLGEMLVRRAPYLTIVDKKRVINAMGLNIIHGHEYKGAIISPVNPARGLFMKTKKTAVCFHHHQTSEHSEPTIEGKLITTWSGGCMCGLNPEYMPLNKWNHGFMSVNQHEDLMFAVDNHRIVNYKLM